MRRTAVEWRWLLYALTGGPHQLPHLAPTYAAICALCIIGTELAFESIDRFVHSSFFFAFFKICKLIFFHRCSIVE